MRASLYAEIELERRRCETVALFDSPRCILLLRVRIPKDADVIGRVRNWATDCCMYSFVLPPCRPIYHPCILSRLGSPSRLSVPLARP
jgi:hypothetical protein